MIIITEYIYKDFRQAAVDMIQHRERYVCNGVYTLNTFTQHIHEHNTYDSMSDGGSRGTKRDDDSQTILWHNKHQQMCPA